MDRGLQGNDKIEEAIRELQEAPSDEQLAHTLTLLRRRMRENGQVVVAVEAVAKEQNLQLFDLLTHKSLKLLETMEFITDVKIKQRILLFLFFG